MKVLIVYGTTEGQTAKIANFVANRLILQHHQAVTTNIELGIEASDPAGFDAILVAASVHAGHYQPSVIEYVQKNRNAIATRHNAFLSVSLAAAGRDPEDLAGLEHCVASFCQETGWTPEHVHHVAGAFRYTQYDFLKRWAMKYIAYRKGAPTDTSRDYELTDWDDVERFVDTFTAIDPPRSQATQPAATVN